MSPSMAETLTPMMRQYQSIKRDIPSDALLFFRLGDFYELFFDDAGEAASLLNLTLTKRNGMPMCGVPHHSAESYISKLIHAGKRVAICEQLSEPQPGKVVERGVSAIFSPGCTLNLDITRPKENRFLAALHHSGTYYGFAFLDASTGEFRLTETDGIRGVQDELLRLQPREVLLPSDLSDFPIPEGIPISRTTYEDWVFEGDFAALTLREHFNVQSLDGFGCQGMRAGIGAAGALIHYLTKTIRSSASHILSLTTYSTSDYLILDAVTQRNLELVEKTSHASSDTSLLKALDRTISAMGGRELRNWILHPLRDPEAIFQRQQTVTAWLEDVGLLEQFREALHEVRDMERLISRVSQGSANARDLQALRQSLEQIPALRSVVEKLDTPLACRLAEALQEQPEVVELIRTAIVEEPPLSLKDGGIIAPGYSPPLDELSSAMREGKRWLADLQVREQERTGIKSLKVRFNQVFGYYIEITKSNLGQVPDDYHRKQTMTNAERFITPELKEMESKILGAEERARKLEQELFLSIRDHVAAHTEAIQASARALAALDVLAGFAMLARLQQYCRPVTSKTGALRIEEGRHPVLEQQLSEEKFVPNDSLLDSDQNRLIVLTGPNMAGKSTYIRQVALIALMHHIGSYVPAKSAEVPVLDRIFTRIGASDDLSRGQSTFMVEMNETANILNNATPKSLIILDEIGRGTSTFDGLSIAWSVAEHLADRVQALTLFATHYHELTELAVSLPSVKNFNVAVREWHDKIIFLRKIVPGGADKSYGIQVARLAGLPRDVISRAKEILRNLEENELDATGRPTLAAHRSKQESASRSRKKKRHDAPQMDLFKSSAKSD